MEEKNANKKKPLAILGTVLRYAVLVILAVSVGISVYSVVASRLGGDPFPMPFGYGSAVILSGSMEPTISVDDLILVKEEPSYQKDDIVVYLSGGSSTVHRILETDGEKVLTKGDANNVADEPISADQIKGKVIAILPKIGYLIKYMRTPMGTIVLVITVLLYSELTYLYSKKLKEEEKARLQAEIDRLKNEKENP